MIKVLDKEFIPYISKTDIDAAINTMTEVIRKDYEGTNPVFIAVLNGAFVFAADFIRAVNIDCEISFIKVKSYMGMESTGEVLTLIGLDTEVTGRPVVIVEDIIDTGHTIKKLINTLQVKNPSSLKIASLLVKPDAIQYPDLKIDYVGISIPNKFVVGYGLDYNGYGRQLDAIYQVAE